MHTRIRRVARNAGKTESELLREIIALVIEQQIPRESEAVVPVPAHSHSAKLTAYLPSFLLDTVKERAKMQGMTVSRWTASLIQSNFLKIPVMTTEELRILGRCINELSAIGRNLNQVVRVLNADFRETDKLKVDLLEVLRFSVQKTLQTIHTLARVSNQRWESL
jgi:hypothetical protein